MSKLNARVKGKYVMLPHLRTTSLVDKDDDVGLSAAKFEGLRRAAASDISTHFFNSFPGVCTLTKAQKLLKWASTHIQKRYSCPYDGCIDYLYPKGSMSLQATKGWHDDANGPASLTCWQNFGNGESGKLQLVIAIHGCLIRINSGFGKIVHFMAWLPHCTTREPSTLSQQYRLHHTSYMRMGTELAANTLNEYKTQQIKLNL